MKHSDIWVGAIGAAERISRVPNQFSDDVTFELYSYARARKFPSSETLARHIAEITGDVFPYGAWSDAPHHEQIYFLVMKSLFEALEPYHEPDPPEYEIVRLEARTIDQAAVIDEILAPMRFTTELLEKERPNSADKHEQDAAMNDQPDEIEQKRRGAQAETDKVIATSGGKFSEPTEAENDAKAKKKAK